MIIRVFIIEMFMFVNAKSLSRTASKLIVQKQGSMKLFMSHAFCSSLFSNLIGPTAGNFAADVNDGNLVGSVSIATLLDNVN